MIKGYAEEVSKIYAQIKDEEANALRERREEIEKKLPEILDIERKIGKLCIDLSISSFNDIKNREEHLKTLRESITNLRIKKSELLVANNYPIDYVSLHYRCNKCKDTGYVGNKKCICYKQKLIKLYYKNSDLSIALRNNNFENFNINYFSQYKTGDEPKTPRKNMEEKIIPEVMNYLKNFSSIDTKSVFLRKLRYRKNLFIKLYCKRFA